MYSYWLLNKSRASTKINLNLWLLSTIRQYAVLSATTLSYFISSLGSLRRVNLKTVKTYYDFLIVFKYASVLLLLIAIILVLGMII